MQKRNMGLGGTRWRGLLVAAVATVATLWSSAAMATITQGDFSIFGFFESREAGHWGEGGAKNDSIPAVTTTVLPGVTTSTPGRAATESGGSFEFNRWDLAEARQLADVRPDYHMVKNYKFLGRFDTLLIKDADFFAFYRPWYDAVGTLKNKGRMEPNRDGVNYRQSGSTGGVATGEGGSLQNEYFRNDLREYYAQLNFTDNFSARIGKQQIIWSEADALSGTEVTNPVDARFHGFYGAESPEDTRINVKMVKLNYILPDYFHTANNELEGFWIPGDFQGAGSISQLDPRNPYVVPAATGKVGWNQNGQPFRNQTFADAGMKPMLFSGGLFFDEITPFMSKRPSNTIGNSEFGARFSSLLPIGNGLQTSLIYLYEFRDQKEGLCTSCSSAQIGPSFSNAGGGVFISPRFSFGPPRPGVPKAGTLAVSLSENFKRNHFFGLTGTYYDKDLTDIVYRYDVLYQPKHVVGVATPAGGADLGSGSRDTELTRFIIAADRPTYIPWLSKQHTFIVAQYTMTWLPDRPSNATPGFFNVVGKQRELSSFAFVSAVNWLMNGQLTSTNTAEWDIDDNAGAVTTTNIFRYSRNVLFGLNAQWFQGRSGRWTDPFLLSRQQRFNELEFTLTYEI